MTVVRREGGWDARTRCQTGMSIRFLFRVRRSGRDGADGMALVLHADPAGVSAMGRPGAQLGYGGIQNRYDQNSPSPSRFMEMMTTCRAAFGAMGGRW